MDSLLILILFSLWLWVITPKIEKCMNVQCTWESCERPGEIKQIATDGEVWAILCIEHNEAMDVGIADLKPKSLLSNWIKAQGGTKAAAKRMVSK